MLDFGALPPEVNSGRMYTGPGSGPLLAAAAAWDGLAGELGSTANAYGSAISSLTGGPWRGPASSAMAAATAPYVGWMAATSAQAEQAAAQAKAAAGAYEAAFAMTVPPPVIAANRSLLMSLLATNVLGQNTPAIAATEAHYTEMWAQDAAAMYGYAGSSSAASAVTPFTAPPATTSSVGATGPAANTGSTLSQLISTTPATLQGLASPASGLTSGATSGSTAGSTAASSGAGLSGIMDSLTGGDLMSASSGSATTGLAGLMSTIGGTNGSALGSFLNSNLWNTIFSSGFFMPGNFLGTMTDFAGLTGLGEAAAAEADAAAAGAANGLGGALTAPLGGFAGLGGLVPGLGGSAVSAGLGQAASIGGLSVPPAVAPMAGALGPGLLGVTPLSAPPAVAAGMPLASPMSSMAGMSAHGFASGPLPRYGFKPSVIARPLVG